MTEKRLINIDIVPDNLLSNLENRDVALWIQGLPKDFPNQQALVDFIGLPWRLVLSEINDKELVDTLELASRSNEPMTRKRGFIQIIESDPSRIELPQRCLPIYLLNGRQGANSSSDFENRLRRMTMLESLRRSGAREILIIADGGDLIPPELNDLWSSGFRSYLNFVSKAGNARQTLEDWLERTKGAEFAALLNLPADEVIDDILARYGEIYPEDRHVIRIRDRGGRLHKIDITEAEEPERPILERYSIVEERDLKPLMPEELSEEDFISFFQNPEASWRPYAAGLPWIRNEQCKAELRSIFKKLDHEGSTRNCISYICSESGAGGTTLSRLLAWECAKDGYPVLLAKPTPFVPDALPIANFLNRVNKLVNSQLEQSQEITSGLGDVKLPDNASRNYETPWLIVFDSLHWQYRESELTRFRRELEKSGRPVCMMVISGPMLGLAFYNTSIFKEVAVLNHALSQEEAHQLGSHLNKFLRVYGNPRSEWQWDDFYKNHTVRHLEGMAAFWVTLSFWIQGQYDLEESIQEWIYRSFKENTETLTIQEAILEIAALSSERLPLPEALLPVSKEIPWPVAQLLEDRRTSLGALGLVRISTDGEKYWALAHDILGRLLINAVFYDFEMRKKLGFATANDAEHLRFMLLRQISQKPALAEHANQSIGEDFATAIFKIDPGRGHSSFAPVWREVLNALDTMPGSLRDTSRLFRHHTAISRRRIAKLDEKFYGVTKEDKIILLNAAIEDINYALSAIEYTPGSEPNLNLFNSLARAYLDLAQVELECGAKRERITELRRMANDATRKAYEENPTNSFVIETFIKNILEKAQASPDSAVENCVEALGIIFSALNSNVVEYRKSQLGDLADRAMEILLKQTPGRDEDIEPTRAIDVLIKAWKTLTDGVEFLAGMTLSDFPELNRARTLEILAHKIGQGNMMVLRLSYDLLSIDQPYAFKKQLTYVEELQGTNYRMTPQLRLEYAVLLFQNDRASEGDRIFRSLRRLWRESEYFVQVPTRLHWLREVDSKTLKTVQAITGSDFGHRAMARINEFGNALVPFRPMEFSMRDLKPGLRFASYVTFGHNGPFLRPLTTNLTQKERD